MWCIALYDMLWMFSLGLLVKASSHSSVIKAYRKNISLVGEVGLIVGIAPLQYIRYLVFTSCSLCAAFILTVLVD